MRALAYIIVFLLLHLAQAQAQQGLGLSLEFASKPGKAYGIGPKPDSLILTRTAYETFMGDTLVVAPWDSVAYMLVKIQVVLNFHQYTIDDSPAAPLPGLGYPTEWMFLSHKGGSVPLPAMHYANHGFPFHKLFTLPAGETLEKAIEREMFEVVKAKSMEEQARIYKAILEDKKAYKKCCPEYIAQAEAFMATDPFYFHNFKSLNIELGYSKVTLHVMGELKSGAPFQLTIIEEDPPTPNMQMLGLRTTIYKVGDIAKAKAWYAQAFGTAPYFDEPFYVGFNIGGYELGLQPEDKPTTKKPESVVSYWGVTDIQATYQHLLDLGATAHEKPTNVGGELMTATVKDPWGNIIGIIYNPYFKIE